MTHPLTQPGTRDSLATLAHAMLPERVFVVGAAALAHHFPDRARATLDIDLAIATRGGRFPEGWIRERPPRQRWRDPEGRPVDVVPVNPDDLATGSVTWSDGTRMSLTGFDLLDRNSVATGWPNAPANLRIAGLIALAVCKMVAWQERPGDREKDLGDIALLLEHYVDDGQDRFHDEPDPDMEFEARAPYLLGRDIRAIGTDSHVACVREFVERVGCEGTPPAAAFQSAGARVGRWDARLTDLRIDALLWGRAFEA